MSAANLKYESSTTLPPDDVLEGIVKCMDQFMRKSPVERWREKLGDRDGMYIQWVKDGDQIVAFKAGYELRPGLFYSWLGGVLPAYRRQGIASRLMADQHAHARKAGCKEIRTISTNEHKTMMILNLREGFDIIETKTRGDEIRIVMSKKL